jgi:hypothetical protein
MPDFYRDTDDRYRRDPDFQQMVKLLEHFAREYGWTPGELKQIAFKAALNIEETRTGTFIVERAVFERDDRRLRGGG